MEPTCREQVQRVVGVFSMPGFSAARSEAVAGIEVISSYRAFFPGLKKSEPARLQRERSRADGPWENTPASPALACWFAAMQPLRCVLHFRPGARDLAFCGAGTLQPVGAVAALWLRLLA